MAHREYKQDMNELKQMDLYLIRLGEISLKGMNRNFFEKKLKNNIKLKIHPYRSTLTREKGRFYLYVSKDCPQETVIRTLKTTFGVVGFSKAIVCEKNWEKIVECAKALIENEPFADGRGTFKVECRRGDKSFPMNSYQIESELGGVVLDRYPEMKVKVKEPEKELRIEVRENVYMYTSPVPGPGGLPVGTAGKGLLLLSGGIDSPVAGWRMAKRGLKQDCLYFHAYPYTSDMALQKVKDLARIIAPYNQGTNLVVINFTECELWIKEHSGIQYNRPCLCPCLSAEKRRKESRTFPQRLHRSPAPNVHQLFPPDTRCGHALHFGQAGPAASLHLQSAHRIQRHSPADIRTESGKEALPLFCCHSGRRRAGDFLLHCP